MDWYDLPDPLGCCPAHADDPPPCQSGYDVRPVKFAWDPAANAKDIFAQIVGINDGPGVVFRCDASTDTADCFDGANWRCIWNFSDSDAGNRVKYPGLGCDAGPVDWRAEGYTWGDLRAMEVTNQVGANGHFEVLFKGRPRRARDEFLRPQPPAASATGWAAEHLRDPVTCDLSGIELLTPVQVVEADLDGVPPTPDFIMTAKRHWFRSTDAGVFWYPFNPFTVLAGDPPSLSTYRQFERAAVLARVPSEPTWLYAFNDAHLWLSKDNGRLDTWERVDWVEKQEGGRRPAAWTTGRVHAGPQPDPVSTCVDDTKRCGRFTTVCGDVNQIAVDPDDEDTVYAATEAGLWK